MSTGNEESSIISTIVGDATTPKRPREEESLDNGPNEKRPRVEEKEEIALPKPSPASSKLSLLSKLKKQVQTISQLPDVLATNGSNEKKETNSQPSIAAVPSATSQEPKSSPKTRTHKKKSSSSTKKTKKPKKQEHDHEEDLEEDNDVENRPKRSRRPARPYTYDDDSDPSAKTTNIAMRKCRTLLQQLRQHKWSWPFNTPVDPVSLGIPDYFTVIKKPMDLETIEQKLLNNVYTEPQQMADDVNLVWTNCFTYNQPGSDVVKMGETLQKYFEEKFQKLLTELNGAPVERKHSAPLRKKGADSSPMTLSETVDHQPKRSQQPSQPAATVASQPAAAQSQQAKPNRKRTKKTATVDSRAMSFDEKKRLSDNIEQLNTEKLAQVLKIIQKRAPKASSQADESDEIVIDLDKLDAVTLRELERYVRTCIVNTKKKNKKKNGGDSQAANSQTPSQQAQTGGQKGEETDSSSGSDSDSSDDSSDDSGSGTDTEGDNKNKSQPAAAAQGGGDQSAPQTLAQAIA